MKNFLLACFVIITPLSFAQKVAGQSYTTVSKSCGSCGGAVLAYSSIGDYCPHCHVRWGYENTSKQTSTRTKNYNTDFDSNYAVVIVNTNLRNEASKAGFIRGIIKKNQSIEILSTVGSWVKIKFSGRFIDESSYHFAIHTGWVHTSCVSY